MTGHLLTGNTRIHKELIFNNLLLVQLGALVPFWQ